MAKEGGVTVWQGQVHEDGPYSILARVTALDATGEEVKQGEGPVVLQADVTSITARVYSLGTNKNNAAGVEVTPAPTVVVATTVFDTLRTVGWNEDPYGYNFRHDVASLFTPEPGEWYLLEYRFVLVTTAFLWVKVKVKTLETRT